MIGGAFPHPADGVLNHGQVRGVVVGEIQRANERHVAAKIAPGGGDRLILGREDDAVERAGAPGRLHRVGQQRLACQRLEILAGYAL